MAKPAPQSISSYLLKLVDIPQRQLDSFAGLQQAMREHMAHTDAKFTQAADMFIRVGTWARGQGDEIVRTNERLATLGELMAERMRLVEERMARTQERMAITDERILATNERLLATEQRIEQLERQIEQLLRALLRGRGDGEGTGPT